MNAVRTQLDAQDLDTETCPRLHAAISAAVPVSAGGYNTAITASAQVRIEELEAQPGNGQAGIAASMALSARLAGVG